MSNAGSKTDLEGNAMNIEAPAVQGNEATIHPPTEGTTINKIHNKTIESNIEIETNQKNEERVKHNTETEVLHNEQPKPGELIPHPVPQIVNFSDQQVARSGKVENTIQETKTMTGQSSSIDKFDRLEDQVTNDRKANSINKVKKYINKKYTEMVLSLEYLKQFEWWDGTLNKHMPIKFMTSTSYWFLVCAQYFPRNAYAGKTPGDILEENFRKLNQIPLDVILKLDRKSLKKLGPIEEPGPYSSLPLNRQLQNEVSGRYSEYLRSKTTAGNDKSQNNIQPECNMFYKQEYSILEDEYLIEMRKFLLDVGQNKLNVKVDDQASLLRAVASAGAQNNLENIINVLQTELNEVACSNYDKKLSLLANMRRDLGSEQLFLNAMESTSLSDQENILCDLQSLTDAEKEYLSMLENNQSEPLPIKKGNSLAGDTPVERVNPEELPDQAPRDDKPDGEDNNGANNTGGGLGLRRRGVNVVEDFVCQICNDGDYTDDDLIVFCAGCNVSVHQHCYGLLNIPNDDWFCLLCRTYGPQGKFMRCPLCTKRGGAMKPCSLRITDATWSMNNPSYGQFAISGPHTPPIAFSDLAPSEHHEKNDELSNLTKPEDREDYKEKLFYDFHQLKDDDLEKEALESEPRPEFAWIHLTCAFWVPDVYFSDKAENSQFEGLSSIQPQRYRLTCSVCRQKRTGAGIQCHKGNCYQAFHPECARRAKLYMEVKLEEKYPYLIYCEKHTPLKLRRVLEAKDKKYREDIVRFCKSIEKYCEAYNSAAYKIRRGEKKSLPKDVSKDPTKVSALAKQRMRTVFGKDENKAILREIIKHYKSKPEFRFILTVERSRLPYLQTQPVSNGQIAANEIQRPETYRLLEVFKPREFRLRSNISRNDEIWEEISFKNYSPQQLYKKYRKIMEERQRINRMVRESERIARRRLAARPARRLLMAQNQMVDESGTQSENSIPRPVIKETRQSKQQHEVSKPVAETVPARPTARGTRAGTKQSSLDGFVQKRYCLCRSFWNESDGDSMIECDGCNEWYHFACVGIELSYEEVENMKEYLCPVCKSKENIVVEENEKPSPIPYFNTSGYNNLTGEKETVETPVSNTKTAAFPTIKQKTMGKRDLRQKVRPSEQKSANPPPPQPQPASQPFVPTNDGKSTAQMTSSDLDSQLALELAGKVEYYDYTCKLRSYRR